MIGKPFRPAHTYSIVARDPESGALGTAVQSHYFSTGSVVTWAEAGVGAVATQSFVNTSFGPRGLELLRQGKSASQAVKMLIQADEGRETRQLAIVDRNGGVMAFTGKRCIPAAGHQLGQGYSVQANLMLNQDVWPAMARAFEGTTGPLAERLVAALEAGEEKGGDIRGQQSAAILVVRGTSTGRIWKDRLIDLRVEDHPEPIQELKRLLRLFRAYEHVDQGEKAMEEGDVDEALGEYSKARQLCPDNVEIQYWSAVSLANAGRLEDALPIFKAVFRRDGNWRTLSQRIYKLKLLDVPEEALSRILSQGR